MLLGEHTRRTHTVCASRWGTPSLQKLRVNLNPAGDLTLLSLSSLYCSEEKKKKSASCAGSSTMSAFPGCCDAERAENSKKQYYHHWCSSFVARDCQHPSYTSLTLIKQLFINKGYQKGQGKSFQILIIPFLRLNLFKHQFVYWDFLEALRPLSN